MPYRRTREAVWPAKQEIGFYGNLLLRKCVMCGRMAHVDEYPLAPGDNGRSARCNLCTPRPGFVTSKGRPFKQPFRGPVFRGIGQTLYWRCNDCKNWLPLDKFYFTQCGGPRSQCVNCYYDRKGGAGESHAPD